MSSVNKAIQIKSNSQPTLSSIGKARNRLESTVNGFRILNNALIAKLKERDDEVLLLKQQLEQLMNTTKTELIDTEQSQEKPEFLQEENGSDFNRPAGYIPD
jgi:hypothetical protein